MTCPVCQVNYSVCDDCKASAALRRGRVIGVPVLEVEPLNYRNMERTSLQDQILRRGSRHTKSFVDKPLRSHEDRKKREAEDLALAKQQKTHDGCMEPLPKLDWLPDGRAELTWAKEIGGRAYKKTIHKTAW
jgi:hypothetical protein